MNSDCSSKRVITPSARILGRVREDATDLALLATVFTHDWKSLRDKNGTQLFEITGESLTSKVSTFRTFGNGGGGHPSEFYLVRATTTVRSDVNTMLDVLRTVMNKIFGKQFESGAIVDSLTPTPCAPSSISKESNPDWQSFNEDDGYNANWITLRAFTKLGSLEGQRDFTMVCYQDIFEQTFIRDKLTRKGRHIARDPHRQQLATGSRLVGVHTFSSMNFKDIPELPRSSKIDRLHFRNAGIVVEELAMEDANGSMVRVSLLLSLMPSKLVLKELSQSPRLRVALAAGHKVAKKYRKWLQTLALGVSHLAEAAKPAVTIQHLTTMTWTNNDSCFLCLKTFRTFRKRYHCRFCGEAVCGSCSTFVDMSSFDVSYESSGSSRSITVGRRRLNLQATIDGSERSESAYLNAAKDSTDEYLNIRGCNTCASELQMNLAIRGQYRNAHKSNLYSSSTSDSPSPLANVCLGSRGIENEFDPNSGHSSISGYAGRDNNFEVDRVAHTHGDDSQQYLQCSGEKMSFSTISNSSFSGFFNDERAQLALDSSISSHEPMSKAPFNASISRPSSCFLMSANEFLTRDSDILSLNGSTLSTGESTSTITVIDDNKHMDLTYQPDIRASEDTNENSYYSRFTYSDMTPSETKARDNKARDTLRMNGRLPSTFHPQQRDHEQSPVKVSNQKVYHMPPTRQRLLSSSHSQKSSYSSRNSHCDLIQLNALIKAPVTSFTGFVVFNGSQEAELPNSDKGDMILLEF